MDSNTESKMEQVKSAESRKNKRKRAKEVASVPDQSTIPHKRKIRKMAEMRDFLEREKNMSQLDEICRSASAKKYHSMQKDFSHSQKPSTQKQNRTVAATNQSTREKWSRKECGVNTTAAGAAASTDGAPIIKYAIATLPQKSFKNLAIQNGEQANPYNPKINHNGETKSNGNNTSSVPFSTDDNAVPECAVKSDPEVKAEPATPEHPGGSSSYQIFPELDIVDVRPEVSYDFDFYAESDDPDENVLIIDESLETSQTVREEIDSHEMGNSLREDIPGIITGTNSSLLRTDATTMIQQIDDSNNNNLLQINLSVNRVVKEDSKREVSKKCNKKSVSKKPRKSIKTQTNEYYLIAPSEYSPVDKQSPTPILKTPTTTKQQLKIKINTISSEKGLDVEKTLRPENKQNKTPKTSRKNTNKLRDVRSVKFSIPRKEGQTQMPLTSTDNNISMETTNKTTQKTQFVENIEDGDVTIARYCDSFNFPENNLSKKFDEINSSLGGFQSNFPDKEISSLSLVNTSELSKTLQPEEIQTTHPSKVVSESSEALGGFNKVIYLMYRELLSPFSQQHISQMALILDLVVGESFKYSEHIKRIKQQSSVGPNSREENLVRRAFQNNTASHGSQFTNSFRSIEKCFPVSKAFHTFMYLALMVHLFRKLTDINKNHFGYFHITRKLIISILKANKHENLAMYAAFCKDDEEFETDFELVSKLIKTFDDYGRTSYDPDCFFYNTTYFARTRPAEKSPYRVRPEMSVHPPISPITQCERNFQRLRSLRAGFMDNPIMSMPPTDSKASHPCSSLLESGCGANNFGSSETAIGEYMSPQNSRKSPVFPQQQLDYYRAFLAEVRKTYGKNNRACAVHSDPAAPQPNCSAMPCCVYLPSRSPSQVSPTFAQPQSKYNCNSQMRLLNAFPFPTYTSTSGTFRPELSSSTSFYPEVSMHQPSCSRITNSQTRSPPVSEIKKPIPLKCTFVDLTSPSPVSVRRSNGPPNVRILPKPDCQRVDNSHSIFEQVNSCPKSHTATLPQIGDGDTYTSMFLASTGNPSQSNRPVLSYYCPSSRPTPTPTSTSTHDSYAFSTSSVTSAFQSSPVNNSSQCLRLLAEEKH